MSRFSRFAMGLLLYAMVLSALGFVLQPRLVDTGIGQAQLDAMLPRQFGDWQMLDVQNNLVTMDNPQAASFEQPYDAQVMRTYRNSQGEYMMLAVAYGRNQRQDIKIHRPEVCYSASGRQVQFVQPHGFTLTSAAGVPVTGKKMLTLNQGNNMHEAVSYWIRIGDTFSSSGWAQRWHILKEGVKGRRTDGVLVRFSQTLAPDADAQASFRLQDQFAQELYNALSPQGRQVFTH